MSLTRQIKRVKYRAGATAPAAASRSVVNTLSPLIKTACRVIFFYQQQRLTNKNRQNSSRRRSGIALCSCHEGIQLFAASTTRATAPPEQSAERLAVSASNRSYQYQPPATVYLRQLSTTTAAAATRLRLRTAADCKLGLFAAFQLVRTHQTLPIKPEELFPAT